jgi:hypothetical protein
MRHVRPLAVFTFLSPPFSPVGHAVASCSLHAHHRVLVTVNPTSHTPAAAPAAVLQRMFGCSAPKHITTVPDKCFSVPHQLTSQRSRFLVSLTADTGYRNHLYCFPLHAVPPFLQGSSKSDRTCFSYGSSALTNGLLTMQVWFQYWIYAYKTTDG